MLGFTNELFPAGTRRETAHDLVPIVAVIRAGLGAEVFEGWAEIAEGPEGWPQ